MDLGLKNKVCVVLASSQGLGKACAQVLLEEGARVAISGRNKATLNETLSGFQAKFGDSVLGEVADVTKDDELTKHLDNVKKKWGTVHVLVLNAGGPPAGGPNDFTLDQLDAAFRLTLRSAIVATRAVLPWMKAQKWGRVIALTSIAVRQPNPTLALSNTMRSGLTGYLKSLANEVAADGILVNNICTGAFETDRYRELLEFRAKRNGRTVDDERNQSIREIPVGRLGDPKELANVVAFLASDKASFMNGTAFPVDGGMYRGLL